MTCSLKNRKCLCQKWKKIPCSWIEDNIIKDNILQIDLQFKKIPTEFTEIFSITIYRVVFRN